MPEIVLVLGGYGVFGSRISMALARDARVDLIDRDAPAFADRIARLTPLVVIDAAGPFQSYDAQPYRVAEAALAAGAHYLDLSDDPDFTLGIYRGWLVPDDAMG